MCISGLHFQYVRRIGQQLVVLRIAIRRQQGSRFGLPCRLLPILKQVLMCSRKSL